jgi:hypothetical protein
MYKGRLTVQTQRLFVHGTQLAAVTTVHYVCQYILRKSFVRTVPSIVYAGQLCVEVPPASVP